MRSLRTLRIASLALLGAVALSLTVATPASAANPPPPGGGTCQITVADTDNSPGDEVRAVDLQEAGGDEIFMRLNGQRFPASTLVTVPFTQNGQGQPATAFGNPAKVYTGSVRVELIEKDFLGAGNTHILDTFVGCAPFSGVLVGTGAGARYEIEVVIIPQ